MKWPGLAGLVLMCGVLAVLGAYLTLPTKTTDATHFDTLIVLGCPTNPDGSASPEERERVLEAVRQFRAGRAEHIILTGAAAHNAFVEADVMAGIARSQGVPEEALVREPKAENTIQNIFYSHALMEQRGWRTAEVISSPNHLPRTALILEHWKFPWMTDAARWPPEYGRMEILARYTREAVGTAKLRWFGFQSTRFLPGSGT